MEQYLTELGQGTPQEDPPLSPESFRTIKIKSGGSLVDLPSTLRCQGCLA